MSRLPCGCDPSEGPSLATRCSVARDLIDQRKDAGGCDTPEGWRLMADLMRHYDDQRGQTRECDCGESYAGGNCRPYCATRLR